MEFPGVFFFKGMSDPYISGFPFIYSFNLIMWAYLVVVIFIAYKLNWGEPVVDKKSKLLHGGAHLPSSDQTVTSIPRGPLYWTATAWNIFFGVLYYGVGKKIWYMELSNLCVYGNNGTLGGQCV
ncbi:MAG: hypothetical protein QM289_02715 [Bacillota bacterium]|nr:hypothetical protein [Bacillota bacterium]NLM08921.1 hypothetical protein [Clostridiales Family XIII bacterium]